MAEPNPFIQEIQAAFANQDYGRIQQLLLKWKRQEPHSPWLKLYIAGWFEVNEKFDQADKIYRQLLKTSTLPKLLAQARLGLCRLEAHREQRQRQAIEQAKTTPSGDQAGILILEPIARANKQQAAQRFAEIFQMDLYSAGLQLPLKSWRLLRTGPLGELRFYSNLLRQGNVPNFCLSFEQLGSIQVVQVRSIERLDPCLNIHGIDESRKPVRLKIPWTAISHWVTGLLPIFEESLDKDTRGKSVYKTKVLDYAHFCDLHWSDRRLVLRLNDEHYQFQRGVPFQTEGTPSIETFSNRRNWQNLQQRLSQQLSKAKQWDDFKSFAANAKEFPRLLQSINARTELFRHPEHQSTYWDPAWQLYSSIILTQAARSLSPNP